MSRLYASIIFGSFSLVACGGGSATPDAARAIDAPRAIDASATAADAAILADAAPAMGAMHHYVVNRELVPTNSTEARAEGLDLNGDGMVDNQFGMVLATFAGQGVSTQASIDTAISHGTTIILGALQTADFTTAADAGFMIYSGANPNPAPCASSADMVCGHHLTGTGTFTLASGGLVDPPLVGNVVAGTLTTPAGTSVMPLPLAFGAAPFTVQLIGARVQVTGASTSGLTAILAGAISNSEMDLVVYPALQAYFMGTVTRDCSALTSPPSCGCASNSTGAQTISLLDADHNCAISTDEVKNNSLIKSLFAPDITIGGQMALSVGVKVTAVAGTFTGPAAP